MYRRLSASVHRNGVSEDVRLLAGHVGRVSCAELSSTLRRFRRLTVLISQRNRGGLATWSASGLSPDIVVTLNHGDEVADAVRICVRGNQMYGWPVLCVVMGASHAYARIEAAAKAASGSDVQVLVVEGR